MTFLRARRTPATAAFWSALSAENSDAPAALQQLARGDDSVVCNISEANTSLTWARQHEAWTENPEPVWIASE